MNIAEGSNEFLLPKNVGLLFFSKNPQKFFPSAKIEIIEFNDKSGTEYKEKIFDGTLHKQLIDSIDYIKKFVLKEKVIKLRGKAESVRYYNYPFEAIEEALCNAAFHRGYDNDSPIEIRIFQNRIDFISFPGPLPPLNQEKLRNNQFDVRHYRNRRIGEFLKELHLTEGRATGIPTILNSLKENNSPPPLFDTDEARSYFKTTFFPNPFFALDSFKELLSENQFQILVFCAFERSRSLIFKELSLIYSYKNYKNLILQLVELKLLNLTIPEAPNSPKQKYITSDLGDAVVSYLKSNGNAY